MRTSLIILILLMLSPLLIACYAQTGQYQNVGGDYGRTWLNDFKAQNPTPAAENSSSDSLWSWGSAPKGRSIINGQLMNDPYYYWKSLNLTSGWMGQVYVDNKTGYPVFGYIDPYTGYPDYFYMDPKTGGPVYVDSGSDGGTTANNLPPWLSTPNGYTSDYSWLGTPEGPDSSDVYGYPYSGGSTGTSYYNSGYSDGYSGGTGLS